MKKFKVNDMVRINVFSKMTSTCSCMHCEYIRKNKTIIAQVTDEYDNIVEVFEKNLGRVKYHISDVEKIYKKTNLPIWF